MSQHDTIRREAFNDIATILERSTGLLYTAHYEVGEREGEFNQRLKTWVENLAVDFRDAASLASGAKI